MKSKTLLICVALVSVFIVACPMPQVGVGPTRDAAGETDQNGPVAPGASISVVNDDARNQAVYINETGQRFDVVAEEYAGGPLVACVQVADFTLVPASTDPDALPVKALVAGMREDGSPGVWEIHADDSIHLPQPEVTDPSGARSIVGGDMPSLPDGIQIRHGWTFYTVAVTNGGRTIVGYAENRNGVTIGGQAIDAGTTVAVYWKVSSLFGGRFCIISPPRIIGSFVQTTPPPTWVAHWIGRSPALQNLWLYLRGTLTSYLVYEKPPGFIVSSVDGEVSVTGISQNGFLATAKIDRYGGITIKQLDSVHGVQVSPSPASTTDRWSVSALLNNIAGTDIAKSVKVKFYVSASNTLSPATLLEEKQIPNLGASGDIPVSTSADVSLSDKGFNEAGTYYWFVTAEALLKNGAIVVSPEESISIPVSQQAPTDTVDLALTVTSASPVRLNGAWSFTATVTNLGTGTAGPSILQYIVGVTPTQVAVGSLGAGASQSLALSGNVSDLATSPGTYHISVVADALNAVAETDETSNNTAVVDVTVVPLISYGRIIIDTYNPADGKTDAVYTNSIQLFKGDGTPIASAIGQARSVNIDNNNYYAFIDTSGLTSGNYYVIISAISPGDPVSYGIRVITDPNMLVGSYDASWTSFAGELVTATDAGSMQLNDSPDVASATNHLKGSISATDPDTPAAAEINRISIFLPY